MKKELYKEIQEICIQALQGKLSLEEFFKTWPPEGQDVWRPK